MIQQRNISVQSFIAITVILASSLFMV